MPRDSRKADPTKSKTPSARKPSYPKADSGRVFARNANPKPRKQVAKKPPPKPPAGPKIPKKAPPAGSERLHVRIAHSGFCSRRAAEKLIQDGRVEVNGQQVREMGIMVMPDDEVRVDGQKITEAKQYTLLLNKPKGVLTTLSDPQGRATILRYLPDYGVQLKPVGRLDMDTSGLLLVTNDGDLAHRLMHPRFGVEKEYLASVQGIPDEKSLDRLRKGIHIEEGKTLPAKVEMLPTDRARNSRTIKVTIHEGRKRQVRQMFEAIGHPVLSLKRVRFGPFYLKGMRGGECRLLGKAEIDELRKMVGLDKS